MNGPDDPNPSGGYFDQDPNASPDPWADPQGQPPGPPPPGHHWEWQGGTWVAVPDAGASTANVDDPTQTPPPGNTNTTTSGGTNLAPFGGVFTTPMRQPLPQLPSVPGAPVPDLPAWVDAPAFKYDAFTPPSVDQALQDPSYQFRKDQGEQSLQRWAAARGTLNDSGTANALVDYGQNAASQEYQNIWNRALNTYTTNEQGALNAYNTNYQTQYKDPFAAKYQSALDLNTPKVQQWQANVDMSRLGYSTEAADVQHNNDSDYLAAWNKYLQDFAIWKDSADRAVTIGAA